VLRRVLGLSADTHAVDSQVLAVAARSDARAAVDAICDERLRFLQSLRTWPVFGNGWSRRVREVRAAARLMALRQQPIDLPASQTSGRGHVPERKAVRETIRTGVPLSAVGVLAGAFEWVKAHPLATAVLIAALVIAVSLALQALARRRRRQQETPMPDTPIVPPSA
jgi:lysozyme family protein